MIPMRIAHLLIGIVALSAALSGTAAGLPAAHAGGGSGTRPHIVVTPYRLSGNPDTVVLKVTGSNFAPDGPVVVQIEDALNLAVLTNHIVHTGDHGIFGLTTDRRYCTPHGRLIVAYDLTLHTFSNTVDVDCGYL